MDDSQADLCSPIPLPSQVRTYVRGGGISVGHERVCAGVIVRDEACIWVDTFYTCRSVTPLLEGYGLQPSPP